MKFQTEVLFLLCPLVSAPFAGKTILFPMNCLYVGQQSVVWSARELMPVVLRKQRLKELWFEASVGRSHFNQ
jgi:hypothetical protein